MATANPVRPAQHDPIRSGVDRYFEVSLFSMVVTGFVTLASTGKLDPISLLSVLSCLGFRGFQFATGNKTRLSVQTTTRMTIGYVFFYVIDLFLISADFINATVHLVLFIMVAKMFSVHRERDNVYLAIISFLMILAAAILTVDSFFMAAFSFFLLLCVTTFVTMEMRRSYRESESAQTNSLNSELPPIALGIHGATIGLSAKQRMARSLTTSAIVLVIATVIGATAIFFILPRISTGYFSALSGRNAFVTGFGDSVQLGDIGRIQQSDAVVMHVQFPKGTIVPVDLKWRGVALDHFDGKRWYTRSWSLPVRTSFLNLHATGLHSRISGVSKLPNPQPRETIEYRVLMEPIGTSAFFLIPTPLSLTSDLREYGIEATGTINSTDVSRQIRIYSGKSFLRRPTPAAEDSPSELPQAAASDHLALPQIDPRIPDLAKQIVAGKKTTLEKATALETYLQTQFTYSLEMYTAPGEDPLGYFLFTRKQGHCEYFASSMAVMLRSLGIPSRIVNGFRHGELNDVTGSYIVRARDAHSWVEAYVPGFGWATFDPTPAGDPLPQTTWSRALFYVDALREFWGEWVINYDLTHQSNLGTTTVSKTRSAFDASRIWFREKYEGWIEKLKHAQTVARENPRKLGLRFVLVFAGLILLLNLRRMITALRKARLASRPAHAPQAAASIWYERMINTLRRRGLDKQQSQTPSEFVETISDEHLKISVANFTEHYERARFADSPEDAGKLPKLYEELETALKD